MRTWLLIAVFARVYLAACAQPQPPSMCFVIAEDRGALRPFRGDVQVVQYHRERIPYFGTDATYLGPLEVLPLQGGPLFSDTSEQWLVYHPLEVRAEGPHLLVITGRDTMRLDLPEDPGVWGAQARTRWDRDTPEVVRFRKGRYRFDEVIAAPWSVKAANELAQRLIAEDEAAYKRLLAEREAYYRTQPPPAPPVVYVPPPLMTQEQWEREVALRPGLEQVVLEHATADTVRVRITGRIMLTGGCASAMPLFGVELLTDTGWVERLPFELVQMDCGMPWADWEDHVLTLPLAWWVRTQSPAGMGELAPGTYRLVFMGADMRRRHTGHFQIR